MDQSDLEDPPPDPSMAVTLECDKPVPDEVATSNDETVDYEWEQQRKTYQAEIERLKQEMEQITEANRVLAETKKNEKKPKKKTTIKKSTRSAKKVKIEEPSRSRRMMMEDLPRRRMEEAPPRRKFYVDDAPVLVKRKREELYDDFQDDFDYAYPQSMQPPPMYRPYPRYPPMPMRFYR